MDLKDDTSERGELLVRLRHGLRKSRQLAEHLAMDPAIGGEARSMLVRLETIRSELDSITSPDDRLSPMTPLWPGLNGPGRHRPPEREGSAPPTSPTWRRSPD